MRTLQAPSENKKVLGMSTTAKKVPAEETDKCNGKCGLPFSRNVSKDAPGSYYIFFTEALPQHQVSNLTVGFPGTTTSADCGRGFLDFPSTTLVRDISCFVPVQVKTFQKITFYNSYLNLYTDTSKLCLCLSLHNVG